MAALDTAAMTDNEKHGGVMSVLFSQVLQYSLDEGLI